MEYFDISRIPNIDRTCDKFNHLFRFEINQALVNRNGYSRFSYSSPATLEFLDPNRPIDDFMHAGAGRSFLENFEAFFGPYYPVDRIPDFEAYKRAFRFHDIAEQLTGDKVDNGTYDRAKKDALEKKVITKYLDQFPPFSGTTAARKTLVDFFAMKNLVYGTDKYLFLYGQAWKLSHGVKPDIESPRERGELSDQDIEALDLAGTDHPFDAVFIRFLEQTKEVYERPILIKLVESLYNLYFPGYPHFGSPPDSIRKLY